MTPEKTRVRRLREGFSLLEVMIAMTILAVGLLGMLAMQIQATQSGRIGRHVTDAASVALDQLEQLRYQAWAATAPTGWTAPIVVTSTDSTDAAGFAVQQTFNVSWRIQDVAGITELRTIDVRVTWNEPGDTPGMPPRRYAVSSIKYHGEEVP